MKCEYCDNVVDINLSICPHCGANLPRVVVVKKTMETPEEVVSERKSNDRFINYFLYGVIVVGMLLIMLFVFLRYK